MLFTIAKCPSVGEWVKKLLHLHNGTLLSSKKKKKKELLPFATAWMDLESIMPSEINQSEKDKYHMILLICGI